MTDNSLPVRRAVRYRELLGLTSNPFPDTAIASYENSKMFDPEVHPNLAHKMASVFLGPTLQRTHKVTFLWSLGAGPEARGYGKSAYLMWIAETINSDYGECFLRLCGSVPSKQKVVALYTSFSTVEALSLSGVLHSATRDFLHRNERVITVLRRAEVGGRELLKKALAIANATTGDYDYRLLASLMSEKPTLQWQEIFAYYRLWHQQRLGRSVFASLVAALRALGVNKILLLVDQLEDFAQGWMPSPKHYRDFGRLAEMCTGDPLFKDCLQVVLTMHPRAMVTAKCWDDDKLGPFPNPNNEKQCVIIRELNPSGLTRLVQRYLSSVRIGPRDGLAPFTIPALERLCALTHGRPGTAISALHVAIENAVDSGSTVIDVREIEEACR